MNSGKVDGLANVMFNMNAEIARIKGGVMTGLMEAGLKIEGSAKNRLPVEHGNLKGSGYTRKAQDSRLDSPAVEVGFTAAYAIFVHENMERVLRGQPRPSGLGVYWGPAFPTEPGNKFLQNAVSENSDKILAIVAHHAKVKA